MPVVVCLIVTGYKGESYTFISDMSKVGGLHTLLDRLRIWGSCNYIVSLYRLSRLRNKSTKGICMLCLQLSAMLPAYILQTWYPTPQLIHVPT